MAEGGVEMSSFKPDNAKADVLSNIRELVSEFAHLHDNERRERQMNLINIARAYDGSSLLVLWMRVECLDSAWVFPIFPGIDSRQTYPESPLSFLMQVEGCVSYVEMDGRRMMFNQVNYVGECLVGVFVSEAYARLTFA